MLDIIGLIIAISGLAIGILSHIRHSECCGIKVDTREVKLTSAKDIDDENTMLIKRSDPIPIPKKQETFTKANYL